MPVENTTPADGISTSASAQSLNRQVFVLRDQTLYPTYAPTLALPASYRLRTDASLTTSNLSSVTVSLFLMPSYDNGADVYAARTFIEWRAVAQMPPDFVGFDTVVDPASVGVVSENWVPLMAPAIIPVGLNVTRRFSCFGATAVSIEIRILTNTPTANQGEDKLVVSIAASQ